jgi:hypothetical protein
MGERSRGEDGNGGNWQLAIGNGVDGGSFHPRLAFVVLHPDLAKNGP